MYFLNFLSIFLSIICKREKYLYFLKKKVFFANADIYLSFYSFLKKKFQIIKIIQKKYWLHI